MVTKKATALAAASLVLGLAAGLSLRKAAPVLQAPAAAAGSPATNDPALLAGVPDVRQSTSFSCGASVLQAVLAYWGIEVREDVLMKACGTTEKDGTPPAAILRVARSYGLKAEMKEGCSLADLEAALARGVPAIVDIQAWAETSGPGFSWSSDWEDGHYVVVLGLDRERLYVEDPSLLGGRGVIPLPEFEARWHDYEGDPPRDASDKSYVRMAIFLEGAKKADLPSFLPVR
jgi:hypothetical protein